MKKQVGFTLLEMVIAISILAVISAAVVFSFNGSKGKGQILISAMDEYAGAQQRLKTDTACYSTSLAALYDRSDAVGASNSFCGADLSKQWNGPYVKPVVKTTDTPPLIKLGQIAPDITLTIARLNSVYTGSTIPSYKWFIIAQGVPSEISTQALVACNGTDDQGNGTTGTENTRKCVDTLSGTGTLKGYTAISNTDLKTVYLQFDETRQ